MKSQDQKIEYGKGLDQALEDRSRAVAEARRKFRAAPTPEAKASAGEELIRVSEQAEIDFNVAVSRLVDRVTVEAGVLTAVGAHLFGARGAGV